MSGSESGGKLLRQLESVGLRFSKLTSKTLIHCTFSASKLKFQLHVSYIDRDVLYRIVSYLLIYHGEMFRTYVFFVGICLYPFRYNYKCYHKGGR